MTPKQKQRAQTILRGLTDEEAISEVFALLQELIDADDRFRVKVKEATHSAAHNERSVIVDGQAVFFSRAGDDITDTHTLNPCPHCGGSGAAEDCKQAAGVPDADLVRDAERYRWLRTYNTAKHLSVTEAFFLGDENLDAEIDAAIAEKKGGA